MAGLLLDVRTAARGLRRSPGFTVATVLTLALGIGANTAIFSVVEAVLLAPLPFAHPDRLQMVWETDAHNQSFREGASAPDFFDFQRQSRSFEGLAAFNATELNLAEPGTEPERVATGAVSHEFFEVLGVRPLLGRGFLPEEDRPDGEPVVVLGHGFWQRRYAGSPAVLGRTLALDGRPHAIVGVLPRGFEFPSGVELWVSAARAFAPLVEMRGVHNLLVLARLGDGTTPEEAQAEMDAIAARLAAQYPDDNVGRGVRLEPLHESVVGTTRPTLLVLLGAVGLVLLVACANVAGMMMARSAARRRELAVRTALGAGRLRLARPILVECVLLGLLGGAGGVALAAAGLDALLALRPERLPRASAVSIDGGVLLFSLGISVLAGLLFGAAPAAGASRRGLHETLAAGGRSAGAPGRGRGRSLLVVGQVAVTVMLAVGAGVLVRSFLRLLEVDPGFATDDVLVLDLQLPEFKYPPPPIAEYTRWNQAYDFYDRVLERIAEVPGVVSAALAVNHPLQAGWTSQVTVDGRPEPVGPQDESRIRPVSTGYFETLRVPLRKGRFLEARDRSGAPEVLLVNEAFARKYFPAEDPVGRSLSFWGRSREIVGVVGDEKFLGLARDTPPAVYPSLAQLPMGDFSVVVRAATTPLSLVGGVREAVWSVDRDLAISNVASLEDLVAASLGEPRFRAVLLSLFSGLALVLAAVGLYGLVAYQVERRRGEMGVRLSLGAQRSQVLGLVIGGGLRLAGLGVVLGVMGALAASRLLSGFVFGVRPADGVSFAVAALGLIAIAAAASYLPARRAVRVDPVQALRSE